MTTVEPPTTRTTLPLAAHAVGKRSAVTCQFKCANACLGPECNGSDNPTFRSIAEIALSRRMLIGAAAASAVVVATDAFGLSNPTTASALPGGPVESTWGWGHNSLPFQPIAPVPASVDALTVPKGYTWSPIIRWGDPLFSDAPRFSLEAQSRAAQERQFGYNCDYLDILADRSGKTGVLVNNHEYVNPNIMFPPSTDAAELRRRGEVYKAAQGMSVVEIKRRRRGGTQPRQGHDLDDGDEN